MHTDISASKVVGRISQAAEQPVVRGLWLCYGKAGAAAILICLNRKAMVFCRTRSKHVKQARVREL
jgi:hypothetical protein